MGLFSSAISKKRIKRWKATRQKGKLHFVILHGILSWGLPVMIMVRIISFMRQIEGSYTLSSEVFVNFLVSFQTHEVIIWSIGGVCFGLVLWGYGERQYQKYEQEQLSSNSA